MAIINLDAFKTLWQNVSDTVKTIGSAIGTKVILIAGSDGTNARAIKVKDDGTQLIKLTGSTVDLRGASADKPLATAVDVGTTYWSVDTDPHANSIEVSDGTNWVVI